MKYYPVHITHFLLGLTWAVALISINAIEFLYFKQMSDTGLFWIVMQNIGIASANSYFLVKTHITPSGLTEETTSPTGK